MKHIVDESPDTDLFDQRVPGEDVCINYPDCENGVPGRNAMCGECLDKARERERKIEKRWESNTDGVRDEYKDFIEYRGAFYEERGLV